MKEEQLRKAFRELLGKSGLVGVVIEGKVKAVDWDKRTYEVALDDGRVLPTVRLKSITDDSDAGICLKPKAGSVVLITAVGEETEQVVLKYNEVEAVELKMPDIELTMENGKLKIKANEVEFNGGNNDGMVKVMELTQKLNVLEQDLNTLKDVFSGWTAVSQDGGAALKTAAATWAGQSIQHTKQTDIENTKITH